jgi:ribosomal protein S18 acetylase RimI-like enzyme
MPSNFLIRTANVADSEAIFKLICELAVFEKAPNEVINSPEKIAKHGWGPNPYFTCWVAELNQEIVGMAICYTRYSTWKGPVLYLEDLIVNESFRGLGIGKALFEICLDHAKSNKFSRFTWQVLEWNQPAIDFYQNHGATFDNEWVNCTIHLFDEPMD